MRPTSIVKRDGQVVPFDLARVALAITRAQAAVASPDAELAEDLARLVADQLAESGDSAPPTVERVQDTVIHVLQESGQYDVAVAYIRYRDARERERRARRVADDATQAAPNLFVTGRDARRRPWDRARLVHHLTTTVGLSDRAAGDVTRRVEAFLAESSLTEIAAPLLLSLVDAAMVMLGLADTAARRAPLRIDRAGILGPGRRNHSQDDAATGDAPPTATAEPAAAPLPRPAADGEEDVADDAEQAEAAALRAHRAAARAEATRPASSPALTIRPRPAPGRLDGFDVLTSAGRRVLLQHSLAGCHPRAVVEAYSIGRLWVDGLDDPARGSQFTASIDGSNNPWQVIAQAYSLATDSQRHWRRVRLVLPPLVVGCLERGMEALRQPLTDLGRLAEVYLYCDGRTRLLDAWPFASKRVSLAAYSDDFLILARLQELGLPPMLTGPHLMQGGWRRRVGVQLALNAQGLEDQHSAMDALAMAAVAAARTRLAQLADDPALAGSEVRYAIYGLAADGDSCRYLDQQVVQEGLRLGVALSRTTTLPEESHAHLGRLFE